MKEWKRERGEVEWEEEGFGKWLEREKARELFGGDGEESMLWFGWSVGSLRWAWKRDYGVWTSVVFFGNCDLIESIWEREGERLKKKGLRLWHRYRGGLRERLNSTQLLLRVHQKRGSFLLGWL